MFKYTEKELASCNQAQLRALCEENNIAWDDKMSKAQLRALLLTVQTDEEIEVPAEAPVETPEESTSPAEAPVEAPEVASPVFPTKEESKSSKVSTALQKEIARRRTSYGNSSQVNCPEVKTSLQAEIAMRQSRYGVTTNPTDVTSALQAEIAMRQSRYGNLN